MLAEILHTKNGCAVLVGIEIAKGKRVAQAAEINVRRFFRSPLRVGENVDVRLFSVAYRLGILVHLYILVRHILEVNHPVVKKVLFSFGNQKVSLYHKFRVKTYKALCMIHGFPACFVDSVHNNLIKLCLVNSRLALDTACCCVTSCYRAVIKKKNLCVLLKTECVSIFHRHIRYDCAR